MNDYEIRQEERRERLERRAALCTKLSDMRHRRAQEMGSIIPMGQPILIGHHSEGRDRRYRDKIARNYQKASELAKKADYYRDRAASVGSGGISSDDPEAVTKLLAQIEQAETTQARMVAANKAVRKSDRVELAAQGFSEARIGQLFTPDFCGRIGFANFELTNNSANIRRMKQRVEQLRAEHAQRKPDSTPLLKIATPEGVTIEENAEMNRLQIFFPGKPSDEIRARLKSNGFRWSPNAGAWQRQLNNGARWAAKRALEAM